MGRSPCCDNNGLKKGPWSLEEDQKLMDYINKHGQGSWSALPKRAGLNRCGKSCRLRWNNYLRPDIKRGNFSDEEERIIINLHSYLGNKWSRIASHLPGRTDNEIKNFCNTHIRKKLFKMGIDPKTHNPISDLNFLVSLSQFLSPSNMSSLMMSPFENDLRFQADKRELAKIQVLQNILQTINTRPLACIEETNILCSNSLAQIDGFINKASPKNTVGTSQSPSNVTQEPYLVVPTQIINIEDEFTTKVLNINDNTLSSMCDVNTDYQLPALISATLEASSANNQMETMYPTCISSHSLNCSDLERWETLLHSEASTSFWDDVLSI